MQCEDKRTKKESGALGGALVERTRRGVEAMEVANEELRRRQVQRK
jgi:hypothetical protein